MAATRIGQIYEVQITGPFNNRGSEQLDSVERSSFDGVTRTNWRVSECGEGRYYGNGNVVLDRDGGVWIANSLATEIGMI